MNSQDATVNKKGEEKSFSFLYLALFLLLYVFLPAFVLSCFFFLRLGSFHDSAYVGPAAAYYLSLALLSVLGARVLRKRIFFALVLICVFSHGASYYVFDLFHDGLTYHQPAVSRIAAGFNPVYDGYMNLGRSPDLWSDQATYFPKAMEYFAATVTAAWGDIQPGKAYGWILLFASVCFALHCTQGKSRQKRLLWLMACLNPVTLNQLFGYMVDGALASLVLIVLLYARFFLLHSLHLPPSEKKAPSRATHAVGFVALSTLCCVKISGLAYAGVIVLCVLIYFAVDKYAQSAPLARVMKLGGFYCLCLLLTVAIMGFVPYVANPLAHRHIFYPLFQREHSVNTNLEKLAQGIYPTCHNRFTRLLFSTMAYPNNSRYPADLKNPLGAPWREWKFYQTSQTTHAGGMGPLFFLLCLFALGYAVVLRAGRERRNGRDVWLLLTLVAITAVQPHSWYVRFVPFVWLFPIVLLAFVPPKKEYLLSVPLLLFFVNVVGVASMSFSGTLKHNQEIIEALAPYKGQYVLLDKSIFQCDGFFDRFGIKQVFANADSIQEIPSNPLLGWAESLLERNTGRPAFGSNIAFEEDIPSLPSFSMSEGVIFYGAGKQVLSKIFDQEEGWNYAQKVKFYTKIQHAGGIEFSLTAAPRVEGGRAIGQKATVYANGLQIGEWVWDSPESSEKRVVIPQAILKESYEAPLHLLTLTLHISPLAPLDPGANPLFNLKFEKMEFRPFPY